MCQTYGILCLLNQNYKIYLNKCCVKYFKLINIINSALIETSGVILNPLQIDFGPASIFYQDFYETVFLKY